MVRIKAIIFDLDDTMHNEDFNSENSLTQSVDVMIKKGLKTSLKKGVEMIKEIIRKDPTKNKFRELVKSLGQEDEEIIKAGLEKYSNADFEKLDIFPDTIEVLGSLKKKYKLVLISQGSYPQQMKKINFLKIRDYFDLIFISKLGEKGEYFKKAIKELNLKPEEILDVGNRIDSELKIGNELGMITVRILKGKYRFIKPREKNEKPDFEINNLKEIYGILNEIQNLNEIQKTA